METFWHSAEPQFGPLIVLGEHYAYEEPQNETSAEQGAQADNASHSFKSFFHATDKQYPLEFVADLQSRIIITYRCGFDPIKRDADGPSPLNTNLANLWRSPIISNSNSSSLGILNNEFFYSDAGWGCMIRTGQSLLANTLQILNLGRDWRLSNSLDSNGGGTNATEDWEIIRLFNDCSSNPLSIQKFVEVAQSHFGTKPGEWFSPNVTAQCIKHLTQVPSDMKINLDVYVTTNSGDIYEDELDFSRPILILSGIRLGIKQVTESYWSFIKFILGISNSVGIAGGRPRSSHYFFGYQGDYLLYLDPHTVQNYDAPSVSKDLANYISTYHPNSQLKKIHLSKIDPSMLIGVLIRSPDDWSAFKQKLNDFSQKCSSGLNIWPKRPNDEDDDHGMFQVESIDEGSEDEEDHPELDSSASLGEDTLQNEAVDESLVVIEGASPETSLREEETVQLSEPEVAEEEEVSVEIPKVDEEAVKLEVPKLEEEDTVQVQINRNGGLEQEVVQ